MATALDTPTRPTGVPGTNMDPAMTRAPDANASPFTPEQVHAIAEAKRRRRKIDQAATVAATSGWITAVIAALATPFVFFSWVAAVMVAGLSLVAYHEFKGRRMLRDLNPKGPRVLGINQVALGVLIIAYSVWHIAAELTGEGRYAEAIANTPELANMLGPLGESMRYIVVAVYATLIIATLIFQGGAAWYYFSRAKHVRAFVEQTPPWVCDLMRGGT